MQAVEQFADRLADAALATPALLAVVPAEGTQEERKLEILRRSITLMQVGSVAAAGARRRGQCAVFSAQCVQCSAVQCSAAAPLRNRHPVGPAFSLL